MTTPFVSVVIPARNEETRLPHTLEQVFAFLETQAYTAEVVVVENGSADRTYQVAQEFAHRHPNLRVLREALPGKGRAVRRGMLEAKGDYRFMCDADLSMSIDQMNRFLPPALTDVDVAIGSREAPGAARYDEPLYRHLGGRLVNFTIRALILPGLQDTQCGFKCFTAKAAEDLFKHQTLTTWSFDLEILFIARKRGYRIAEIPIQWRFNAETKLNPIRDAIRLWFDIFKIHYNNVTNRY